MTDDRIRRVQKRLLFTYIALLLICLAGLWWLYRQLTEHAQVGRSGLTGTVYARLPEFVLTERSGRPLGLRDLSGKVWIADFIFTSCPGPCPRMSASMAALQKELGDAPDLRFVSISVDPDTDTPEVLAGYANRYGARPDRWFFLTGSKQDIHTLAKDGFLVGGIENVMEHSTRFILVDRTGGIRGYYDSQDQEAVAALRADTLNLLRSG
ncbi:MAG: SCO family protein [Acidobacteriota bacterium]